MFANRLTFITFWCLLFSLPVASQQASDTSLASYFSAASCPVPTYVQIDRNQHQGPENGITIQAQRATLAKNQFAKFSGNVALITPEQTITADSIAVNRENNRVEATGEIHFSNDHVDIFAKQLNTNNGETTEINNTSYQLKNALGHGQSEQISVSKAGNLSLKGTSYTTCFSDTPEWSLKASTININSKRQRLEAYNVRFSVLDVPVVYFPYFYVPITPEKQTGFLAPRVSTSSNTGFQLETPFFIDIADFIDATITPKYMSKRGNQLLGQVRYLTGQQYGEVHLEYLNKDIKTNQARYLYRVEHIGTFSEHFRAYVDVTTIGDDNYLVDIESEQYNANDTYLYQIGELAYFDDAWSSTLKVQDFEILGNHQTSYRTVPHLELDSSHQLNVADMTFENHAELTRFETTELNKVEADRYHLETGITLPISQPAWFMNSELKLLHTHYRQRNIQADSLLSTSINRTLPKVRLHGGLFLERDIKLFSRDYLQTFEPQVQYLYIGDQDQTNIGLYDTTVLQDDYNGLFRDTRYSGLDRIAQANQYTWGVTSRMFNSKNMEIFRLSLGRIVHLNGSNSRLSAFSNANSSLATDLYFRLTRKLQLSTSVQYNTQDDITRKSQTNIDYRINKESTVQLNHRYVRDVSDIEDEQVTVEQMSLIANTKINHNWHLIGRITRDLQDSRSLESFAGFEYVNCCWGIRAAYHRHIKTDLDSDISSANNHFDNGFKVEFVYNGMNNSGGSSGVIDLLSSSIFGYKRPYFLNN